MSIAEVSKNLGEKLNRTPVMESTLLNQAVGSRVFFKCENFQKIGAFKARGALNAISKVSSEKIVAYSSGNHAQAVAWACRQLKKKAVVFMAEGDSDLKKTATRAQGAQLVVASSRVEAEQMAQQELKQGGVLIPPFDHDDVIDGQGTACWEALEQVSEKPCAVFVPCGGGGLLSGTFKAVQESGIGAEVYGCEPAAANDASISYRQGKIHRLSQTPDTIADGTKTLQVSERTFHWIQQTQGILEIAESDIVLWTQWLTHILKLTLEPSAVLGFAGSLQWLKKNSGPVLVILSGGNLGVQTRQRIWSRDELGKFPF